MIEIKKTNPRTLDPPSLKKYSNSGFKQCQIKSTRLMNDSCLSYFYSALLYGGLHFGTEVKCLESTSTFFDFCLITD